MSNKDNLCPARMWKNDLIFHCSLEKYHHGDHIHNPSGEGRIRQRWVFWNYNR